MEGTINIIAAVASNGAIGKDNALLWHIREDLQYFKKVTLGCPVIMGRKTFESIGRPLPGRMNIVVSRSWAEAALQGGSAAPEGILVASSLEQAIATASASAPQAGVFVIGGGEIYRQAMPLATGLYITEVHKEIPEADTFFPEIDPAVWTEAFRTPPATDPTSSLSYSFVIYRRSTIK